MPWFFCAWKSVPNEHLAVDDTKMKKEVMPVNKFMDVDLIESLGAIMRQNTGFYQSDFEIDKEMLKEAMSKPEDVERTFLWLSRPCGTNCFKERQVFMKDSYSYNAWQFYGKADYNGVLAYAVEITHNVGNVVRGNLYELDFIQHCKHVAEKALPIDHVRMVYERGIRKQSVTQSVSREDDPLLGKFLYSEYQTKNPTIQRYTLWEEKRSRDCLKQGNFKEYLESLHTGRIETEARRIVDKIRVLEKPNSPDGEYFKAELSSVFIELASNEDIKSLFFMMPYKKYAFSKKKESHDIHVLVAKEENRNKRIRKIRKERRIENEDDQFIEFKGRSRKEFFSAEYFV